MAFIMDRINNVVVRMCSDLPETEGGERYKWPKDLLTMSAEEFWKHIESLREKFNKKQ